MEQDRHKHILITVSKKPHGEPVPDAPQLAQQEAVTKAANDEARKRLAVLASLYRIFRG